MDEDLLASVVSVVASTSNKKGNIVALRLAARHAYRLSRLISLRSKAGCLASKSTAYRAIFPTIFVESSNKRGQLLSSEPLIRCAVEDGDLAVSVFDASAAPPWMVVSVVDSKKASLNLSSGYLLSLGPLTSSASASSPAAWAPLQPSQHVIKHVFPRKGLQLTLTTSSVIDSNVRTAFKMGVSRSFGLDGLDEDLRFMVPTPSRGFQQKLVFGGTDSEAAGGADRGAPNAANISVWTNPAASGSVCYALSILRASGLSGDVLSGGVLALLHDKVTYIRNTAPDLAAEVVETLVMAAHSFGWSTSAERGDNEGGTGGGNGEGDRGVVTVDSVALFSDIVRLLFRLSAESEALLVGNLAVRVCGDGPMQARALVLHARCLEASTRFQESLERFKQALAVLPEVVEWAPETEAQFSHESIRGEAEHAIARLAGLIEKSGQVGSPPVKSRPDFDSANETSRGACELEGGVGSPPSSSLSSSSLSLCCPPKSAWERLVVKATKKAHKKRGYECVEERARLSGSVMYKLMNEFYEKRGMDAWGTGEERRTDIVPFYVTSNPHIVSGYLAVVLGSIRDALSARENDSASPGSAEEPFYVIELGAGPGKFSALFLAGLAREVEAMAVKVVYVMTDFTEVNLKAWESDPALTPHFESGLLDSGLLNCDDPEHGASTGGSTGVVLRRRGVVLSPSRPCANPIVAFSNYVFDSVRMDAFRVRPRGELHEALVSTFVKDLAGAGDRGGGGGGESWKGAFVDPSVVGNFKQEWTYEKTGNPLEYYGSPSRGTAVGASGGVSIDDAAAVDCDDVDDDDDFVIKPQPSGPWPSILLASADSGGGGGGGGTVADGRDGVSCSVRNTNAATTNAALGRVLQTYAETLPADATFTLPTSGLRMIAYLRSLSRCGVTMLIADKGYNRAEMVARQRGDPAVSLQGNLALTVNLDAVGMFVRALGGQALHTPQQHSPLDVCLVTLGGLPGDTGATACVGVEGMCAALFVEKLCLVSVCDLFTLRDHVEDVVAANVARSDGTPAPLLSGAPSSTSAAAVTAMPLPCIVLLLRLSCWDPDCVWQFGEQILQAASHSSAWDHGTRMSAEELWQALPLIEEAYTPRFDPDGSTRVVLGKVTSALGALFKS